MIIARHDDNGWLAMGILCLGALMIVLDVTIVNVALPSIRASLGFSETSLAASVRTAPLTLAGTTHLEALAGGYRAAFLVAAGLALLAALLSASMLRFAPQDMSRALAAEP